MARPRTASGGDDQAPAVIGWLQRFGRDHPILTDTAIAAGVALIGLPSLRHDPRWGVALTAALCLPLVLRRRYPRAVFAAITVVLLVQWLTDVRLGADLALLVSLYTVAAVSSRRWTAAAVGVAEVGAVLATLRWGDPVVPFFVGLSALVIASALLGISVQNRRALLASLQERAARLELERDQQGRVAAAAERARIAREMHDIVAHNLAVVIALADGAVFAAHESPKQATAAMEKVSRTGREALAEMRRLLGVLNDESAGSRVPQPGISELEQLVAQVRTTGVPVDLEIEGDPAGLPAGVQLATYRIVQEALTNTLKHAGPRAAADVRVLCVNGTIEVDVEDHGKGGPAGLGGRGLDGMRQRAAVFGGTVDAGPAPGGGWQVKARLMVEPDPR
ncbi:MAG TPA: histidine kinase [Gaiellales bacterium]|nr:histidine kinase [Gaiellales bacterium]